MFNDDANDTPDDDAYARALAECDTCDNISCPRGHDEPATWTLTVEQFDEGTEEFFNRTFRACGACNRSCRRSFMGHKVKSRTFDNSTKMAIQAFDGAPQPAPLLPPTSSSSASSLRRHAPIPGTAAYAREHPADGLGKVNPPPTPGPNAYALEPPVNTAARCADPSSTSASRSNGDAVSEAPLSTVLLLQDALQTLSGRPTTPAAFVATTRVRHDALCPHSVTSCPACSRGLVCCKCARLFTPAVARHLACTQCGHVAFTCCGSSSCCVCNKPWLPTDAVLPPMTSAPLRFRGGAGSDTGIISSPEPDIWAPSPRSSPDEIDDLTARANIALPVSRADSGSSRASSRASTIGGPANFDATPLPTPDFSTLSEDSVDGFVHPSFPDRAILDKNDRRHFLGRGDLSISSLRLYARRIFTDTTHWISAGHLLVDIFSGATINGSRDDFRRFVLLVGTQLGFGDLAQSMSESLDVNQKMADEYMRLRDVASTWKQKAKDNAKSAKEGRKARDELTKARDDITAILEEREVLIQQRREFMAKDDQLATELNRVHRDYGNAIDDNAKFAATIETLEQNMTLVKNELYNTKNLLSIAEHHRDKAEQDCGAAVLRFDKEVADRKRDKAFYEARILALSGPAVPTSQPDSESPLTAAAIDKAALTTRVNNLKKELLVHDTELAKLRSEVSLSSDVNTLRAELAEAKAVAARLSGMYEEKSKDFRESELERLALLGKQILADGEARKDAPPSRPRPASRRGRQRSRSDGRASTPAPVTLPSEATPASSQPFWQDEPLFTKHVAAVTTATMSALPHLPFEAAIANAFTTVRNVGPPPPLKMDKRPGKQRSGAPSPPTPAPAIPHGNFTFADMVKATTSNNNEDSTKKKPTWRAMETSKALVLRPSTKGTRVSELHLKIPKTADSAELFRLKGTALLERIAKIVNDHSEPAPRMALRENPLVLVKWSMKGNLVLKCAKPMDDLIKDGIKSALEYFFPSPSAEIMILNKPPTTALKFLAVPRHNLDGSDTDDMDLLNDLTAHPMWADVELWASPKFINLKQGMAGATVVVSVVDNNQGTVGRRLMGTMVDFSGCLRPCKRWVELLSQPFCGQCQSWGHPGARCPANVLICARCGGTHDYRQHDRYCDTCKKGPGHSCTPFCRNCRGSHMSTSKECPFYLGRTSKERHAELYAEIEAKYPRNNPKGAQAGPTRKSGGARKKVGFSKPDAEGFIQVGTPGIARIDAIPEPEAPASIKPTDGSIVNIAADEVLRPELKGNEEARRLMQETLLDEAAFAAADAAEPPQASSGSPPLKLSYA
ncbi:hypothetical protein AX14_000586 [Amanita brunnescens Koide BX004]|nr:hypothetical protein AX14_000586 [Amanita brunnescens Koide BX004]